MSGPLWSPMGVPIAPLGNPFVVGIASGQILEPDARRALLDAVPADGWTDGSPLDTQALPGDVAVAVMERLAHAVRLANDQHFRFELSGFVAHDPCVLARHRPGGDDEALFTDLDERHSTRKLTVVLPLDDGAGGGPAFPAIGKESASDAGVVSIFPSYLAYRLRPVDAPRVSIWGWVHGPHIR